LRSEAAAVTTNNTANNNNNNNNNNKMMHGQGFFGAGGFGSGYGAPRRFEEQYHCYSVAYADKMHLEVSVCSW
jgi:hypothetical protein